MNIFLNILIRRNVKQIKIRKKTLCNTYVLLIFFATTARRNVILVGEKESESDSGCIIVV